VSNELLMQKPVVLLIDNSISFTGAFKCALQQADLMKPIYEYVFVLPQESGVIKQVEEQGFRYYTLPMLEIRKDLSALTHYLPRLYRNLNRLQRIVESEFASIVVVNDFYNLLGAGLKLKGWNGKLITHVRFLPSVMPAALRRLWIGLARRYSDYIISVSEAVHQQLPKDRKFVRIYDPVSFPEWDPPKSSWEGGTKLMYLGNYIPGKGQDLALRAFQLALKRNGSLKLSFVGGDMGLEKNKAFRRRLEEEAREAGIERAVHFLPFTQDVEKRLKASDVVLNFSEAESFSMTCAEACFYGLPVIATRCGGPEEIIVQEETGLLVDNKNIEQMAEAMVRLSASKQLRMEYGTKAREYVKEKFSVERYLTSLKKLLDGDSKKEGRLGI
jgi:L-malate glycosyltransferase